MAQGTWTQAFPSIVEHTKARGSAVNTRVDGLGSNYDMLPAPHDDGKKGFFEPCYVGDATLSGHVPNVDQIVNGAVTHGVESGVADAYVVAMGIPVVAYIEGLKISFKATATNTGASTVNVDGIGIVSIKSSALVELPADSIYVDDVVELLYTGSFFQLISTTANVANASNSAAAAAASEVVCVAAEAICTPAAVVCSTAQPICADAQVSCEEDRILAENAAASALASSGITYLAVDWTATAGQTIFDTVTTYVEGIEQVYLNGRKLLRTTDFTTTTTSIILLEGAKIGDSVQFVTGNHASQGGLETITEGGNTGWRLDGRDPDDYENIGEGAVDLSSSTNPFITKGASGTRSYAEGVNNSASADDSHVEGAVNEASGRTGHAEGEETVASGIASHSQNKGTIAQNLGSHGGGTYNIGTAIDTVLEIGVGTSDGARANGFEIYTDGTLTAPESSLTDIDSRGATALVTNEFVSRGGSTASRPVSPRIGSMYFDWDLSKPVWYNGAAWVDATGAVV